MARKTRDEMNERQYVNRPSQAGKRPPSKRLKRRRAVNFENAQPGYYPNPIGHMPALDDMDSKELMQFWQWYQNGRNYRDIFPSGGKGTKSAVADLANYAANLSTAKALRLKGRIADAQMYEDISDKIYNDLPEWAKPDYEPNPAPKRNPRSVKGGPLHVVSANLPPSERKADLPHLFPQPGGAYFIAFWKPASHKWVGAHVAYSLKEAREWVRKSGYSKAVLLQ